VHHDGEAAGATELTLLGAVAAVHR
jgi:hypothetical protein